MLNLDTSIIYHTFSSKSSKNHLLEILKQSTNDNCQEVFQFSIMDCDWIEKLSTDSVTLYAQDKIGVLTAQPILGHFFNTFHEVASNLQPERCEQLIISLEASTSVE